jgi:hypothetical protein
MCFDPNVWCSWYPSFLIDLFWPGETGFGASWASCNAWCRGNSWTLWAVQKLAAEAQSWWRWDRHPRSPGLWSGKYEREQVDLVTGETLAPLQHEASPSNLTTDQPQRCRTNKTLRELISVTLHTSSKLWCKFCVDCFHRRRTEV